MFKRVGAVQVSETRVVSRGFAWKPPSELGWRIIFSLIAPPKTRAGLARELNKPLSRVSEALANFSNGLISGNAKQQLILESSIANEARFSRLEFPSIDLARELSGSKASVFFAVSRGFGTVESISWATGLSAITVKRILSRFQKIFLVFQPKRGVYRKRSSDFRLPRLCQLLNDAAFRESRIYSSVTQFSVGGRVLPSKILLFGRVVLCKNLSPANDSFVSTGLSLFHEYGVELVSSGPECVSQDHALSREEILIHAIALNAFDNRALAFCALFLLKNKVDLKKVKKLSYYFKCSEVTERLLDLVQRREVSEENVFTINYRNYGDDILLE